MRLRVCSATGRTSEIVLANAAASLGRDPECAIAFDPDENPMVSGLHARLDWTGDALVLTPVSRSNKTLVNGAPIDAAVEVKQGDRIRLGFTGPSVEIVSIVDAEEPATFSVTTSLPSMPMRNRSPQLLPTRAAPPPPVRSTEAASPRMEATVASKTWLWAGVGSAGALLAAVLLFAATRGRDSIEPVPAALPVVAKNPEPKPVKIPESKPVAPKVEAPTVPSLLATLKSGDAAARVKALDDLGRFGPAARPALEAVLEVLKDDDPESRASALRTLAQMGPANKDDLPIYSAALFEPNEELRVHAAGQLANLGKEAKADLVFLRMLSSDENERVKNAAKKAVARIEDELWRTLAQGIQDRSAIVRSQSAQELAEMGVGAKPALPNLTDALADTNSAVRLAVVDAFVAIGPDATAVLGEALRDKSGQVRSAAINILGRMGPDARSALPELIAVALDPDTKTRDETLLALSRIGEYAIPYLLQAVEREKDKERQQPLLAALERIGQDSGPALRKAMESAKPEVAKATSEVMVKVAAQPKPAPRKEHVGAARDIQLQLRKWFDSADANKDEYLDKAELARAIRGADALPFDVGPADKLSKKPGAVDLSKYPDQVFLSRVDRDNDGKISRDEFELWAYDYAEETEKDDADRVRVEKAQAKLTEEMNAIDAVDLAAVLKAQQSADQPGQSVVVLNQSRAAVALLWVEYYKKRHHHAHKHRTHVSHLWDKYEKDRIARAKLHHCVVKFTLL